MTNKPGTRIDYEDYKIRTLRVRGTKPFPVAELREWLDLFRDSSLLKVNVQPPQNGSDLGYILFTVREERGSSNGL